MEWPPSWLNSRAVAALEAVGVGTAVVGVGTAKASEPTAAAAEVSGAVMSHPPAPATTTATTIEQRV